MGATHLSLFLQDSRVLMAFRWGLDNPDQFSCSSRRHFVICVQYKYDQRYDGADWHAHNQHSGLLKPNIWFREQGWWINEKITAAFVISHLMLREGIFLSVVNYCHRVTAPFSLKWQRMRWRGRGVRKLTWLWECDPIMYLMHMWTCLTLFYLISEVVTT